MIFLAKIYFLSFFSVQNKVQRSSTTRRHSIVAKQSIDFRLKLCTLKSRVLLASAQIRSSGLHASPHLRCSLLLWVLLPILASDASQFIKYGVGITASQSHYLGVASKRRGRKDLTFLCHVNTYTSPEDKFTLILPGISYALSFQLPL